MRLKQFWLKRVVGEMQPDMQLDFAQALLHADAPVPDGVVDPKGRAAPKRFAVYRNNVTTSLVEALQATFPAVAALVGEDFFKEMARIFMRQSPPQSPLLSEYGRDFPAFIETFAPAEGLPFLSDVARLDRVWLDAYHAADALPLAPERVAQIDQDMLVEARFNLHPAARLVVSTFPVADIWKAARAGTATAGIDPTLHQSVLVTRPDIEVQVHGMSHADGVFFGALAAGETIGAAAELALAEDGFDLGRCLGLLISSGAVTGIEV